MLTISDLRERLNVDGLNYTAIAKAAGCSTKTLQRIRKDKQKPNLELANAILAALDTQAAKRRTAPVTQRDVDPIVLGATAKPVAPAEL